MRINKFTGFFVGIVAGICLVGTFALSQDKPADKSKAGGMDEAMMKQMMADQAPGPHHKAMEPMAGKFKFVNKWKMDPSQDWMTSEGDYEGTMAMDGRYLLTDIKGSMMGMPFTGMGCLGYDNLRQKHVAAWIDSMSTGIMRSEGTCTADCKTITFEGEDIDPATKKPTKYKFAYEIKSPDEFTMRWWAPTPSDGKMFEMMTIEYKRVK